MERTYSLEYNGNNFVEEYFKIYLTIRLAIWYLRPPLLLLLLFTTQLFSLYQQPLVNLNLTHKMSFVILIENHR